MCESPSFRSVVLVCLIAALLLPIVICVILGVGFLLQALGDVSGGTILARIALACGIVWTLDLIVLLVAQAVWQLTDRSGKGS